MANIHKAADIEIAFLAASGAYMNVSGAGVWPGLVQEHTLTEVEGRTDRRYIGANTRNPSIFTEDKPDYTGTVRYFPQDGKLWVYAVGSIHTAGSTHTISEQDNPSPNLAWFELQETKAAGGTNLTRKIGGCQVDSLTLRGRMGEPIECELNYTAGSVTFSTDAGSTATAETKQPYQWDDGLVTISGAALNGSLLEVREFEFSVNNNNDHPHYLAQTRFKGESIPGNREVMSTFTLSLAQGSGGDLYDKYYKGGSDFNVEIKIDRGHDNDGDRIRIAMSGCKLTSMEMPSPHEGAGLEQTLEVKPTGGTTIVINDDETSYPYINA